MEALFTPARIGTMTVSNRFVRSATAEGLADANGRPLPALAEIYRELVRGEVGLIITGHMFVHPSGRAHTEMTGVYSDALIAPLAQLADAVHEEGGRVVAQINHGGMQCSQEAVSETMAPSAISAPFLQRPAREMAPDEIEAMILAYGAAARRVQQAGFDGVQIHGAHGYLVGQFLSPFTNRRTDRWGGDLNGRMSFLRAVCAAIRDQVGPDFPMLIKLGVLDGVEGGLIVDDGLELVAALEAMGLDAVEISGAIGGGRDLNSPPGIRSEEDEAFFRPMVHRARPVTRLPVMLVGGLRSRRVMEDVLQSGDADFVSMCRPLICEPDLPRRLRLGLQDKAACISGNRCWPKHPGDGIACKCPVNRPDRVT